MHNQGLRQLFCTVFRDLRAYRATPDGVLVSVFWRLKLNRKVSRSLLPEPPSFWRLGARACLWWRTLWRRGCFPGRRMPPGRGRSRPWGWSPGTSQTSPGTCKWHPGRESRRRQRYQICSSQPVENKFLLVNFLLVRNYNFLLIYSDVLKSLPQS